MVGNISRGFILLLSNIPNNDYCFVMRDENLWLLEAVKKTSNKYTSVVRFERGTWVN